MLLDHNHNFKLDSQPREWPDAIRALGISAENIAGFQKFLDQDKDGAISLQVSYCIATEFVLCVVGMYRPSCIALVLLRVLMQGSNTGVEGARVSTPPSQI